MIHDASRRRVQPATSATIAGRATAVTISSSPARKTPVPITASSSEAVAARQGIHGRECRGGPRIWQRCRLAAP